MRAQLRGALADLASTAGLSEILAAPVRSVERAPLTTVGFAGARHDRLRVTLDNGEQRSLVLKQSDLARDWTAVRTGDARGRELALLEEPALDGVWHAFACPYLAGAREGGTIGLLMDDLSDALLPDVREPLREEQEEALAGALARLHAAFWQSPALALDWLATPAAVAGALGPECAADPAAVAVLSPPLQANLARGWEAALRRLPAPAAALLRRPAAESPELSAGLPRTLAHGDVKVANFALLPDGRVAAFDFAMLAAAPPSLDLGWYLAVNASRLTGSREAFLDRYRAALQRARGEDLDAATWSALLRAAVMQGARELLWSKALACESGNARAVVEWEWWAERLEQSVA